MAGKATVSSGANEGPTWWDVSQQWWQVRSVYETQITVQVSLVRAVNGQLGFRLAALLDGVAVPSLVEGFGRAYSNSPKTFPATLVRLLWAVEDRMVERRLEAARISQTTLDEMIAGAGDTPA